MKLRLSLSLAFKIGFPHLALTIVFGFAALSHIADRNGVPLYFGIPAAILGFPSGHLMDWLAAKFPSAFEGSGILVIALIMNSSLWGIVLAWAARWLTTERTFK